MVAQPLSNQTLLDDSESEKREGSPQALGLIGNKPDLQALAYETEGPAMAAFPDNQQEDQKNVIDLSESLADILMEGIRSDKAFRQWFIQTFDPEVTLLPSHSHD